MEYYEEIDQEAFTPEASEMTMQNAKASRPRNVADQSARPLSYVQQTPLTHSQDFPAPTNETPSQASNSLEEHVPTAVSGRQAEELQLAQVMPYEEFVQEEPID